MSLYKKIGRYKKTKRGELRKFGLLMSAFLLLFFYVLWPFVLKLEPLAWPFWLSLYFFFFGIYLQENLLWFYTPWMLLAEALGFLNLRIFLGIFYFLILTPYAFLLRGLRKEGLRLHFEKEAKTYKQKPEGLSLSNKSY